MRRFPATIGLLRTDYTVRPDRCRDVRPMVSPGGGRYRPGTADRRPRRTTEGGSIGQGRRHDTSWGVEDGYQDEPQAPASLAARARLVRIVLASVRVRTRTELDLG